MAGLAVLIIRAADLSYIGRGTMGPGKKKTAATGERNAFFDRQIPPHRGGLSGGGRNGRGMRQPDHVRKL
mgnify:CR=1 FL=1